MPPNKPGDTDRTAGNGDSHEQALAKKVADTRLELGPYIRRSFPLSFRGYNRAAVDGHLELIVGWLSLTGVDTLIRERFNEQDPVTRQLREQAERDVEQVHEDARREADRRVEEARREADRRVEEAHREADRRVEEAHDEARRVLGTAYQEADRIGADAVAVYAVNQFVGQAQPNEIFLTMGELAPPALLGTPEEQREQAQRIRPVARVSMSPAKLQELVKVLQETLANYERVTDDRQDTP